MTYKKIAQDLYARIEHGDDEHRAWLKRELDNWAIDATFDPEYWGCPRCEKCQTCANK